jgi:hypothetical protein
LRLQNKTRCLLKTRLLVTLAVLFCGWFLMKFHMDTANDSETQAYVGGLLASAAHATLATDATGQYTALAPYVMWPFAANLELLTGAYLIRSLVFALLALGIALHAAAYSWCRTLGISPLTSVLALVLLSTSAAFALQIRGWEIDKLLEPILYLLAALAAWNRRHAVFVILAALAAANAVTGIFAPLVILLSPSPRTRRFWWALAIALVLCTAEVLILGRLVPPADIPLWIDAHPWQLVNIVGGFCLLPALSLACGKAAPPGLRWFLYGVAPAWVVFVVATHRLDQGAVFLAPLALVWLPVTLLGAEQLIRTSAPGATAPRPEVPVAPGSPPWAPGT